jgi:hypothetical protein
MVAVIVLKRQRIRRVVSTAALSSFEQTMTKLLDAKLNRVRQSLVFEFLKAHELMAD